MVTVDQNGRIVIPQRLRERLGMTPGTVVEIREEDGTLVVEPEDRDDPDRILERMKQLIEETGSNRGETSSFGEEGHPVAQKHRDRIHQGTTEETEASGSNDS